MKILKMLQRVRKLNGGHITRRGTELRTIETVLKLQAEVGDRRDDKKVIREMGGRISRLEQNPKSAGKDEGRPLPFNKNKK